MTQTVASDPLDPDALVHRVGSRPRHILRSMINIQLPDSPTTTTAAWPARASSLGVLDQLPPEIMMAILSLLDLQSTARFASVCFLGRSPAHASRAYRDVVAFALEALFALKRLGLAGAHSVADLHAALCAERCTSCNDYGVFLFLPTAERCCWECVRHNPQLRLLSLRDAKRFFVLSKRSVDELPRIHVIPGEYGLAQKPAAAQCVLTTVAAARALGIREHGSLDKLAGALLKRYTTGTRTGASLLSLGRFLQRGPRPVAQGQDICLLPTLANIPDDRFFGMASLPFPFLSPRGHIELGLWCEGCSCTLRQYSVSRVRGDVLKALVPPESKCHPTTVLMGLERRAYPRKAFLRHIKHCYGAQQLVPELRDGA
ncbi:F-box domain-containing protein [Niveomyces insectorum RCEF 264]|uniref:F-box domain-containing protein n=1 Tax=Niveomyces insectorum RCEF 264 TaxID=1081102 RepID=A0A162ICB2_9HYPO|nr:F-box domain-containing protein [Niveomyces insectorum RCEF 264]